MVKYIGKLGTEAVGLTVITKLDFGRSSCHLAANGGCLLPYATTKVELKSGISAYGYKHMLCTGRVLKTKLNLKTKWKN